MKKTITAILIGFTCLLYSQSKQTLEGIWKIKDLTIIEEYGRSWDKEFELFNGIIDYEIQFTTDHFFKDRSDSFFHILDNLKWEVLDSNRNLLIGIKPSNTKEYSLEAVFEIVKHDHSTIFLIYSNTVLELKKADLNDTVLINEQLSSICLSLICHFYNFNYFFWSK
jgi:hypothetical protein